MYPCGGACFGAFQPFLASALVAASALIMWTMIAVTSRACERTSSVGLAPGGVANVALLAIGVLRAFSDGLPSVTFIHEVIASLLLTLLASVGLALLAHAYWMQRCMSIVASSATWWSAALAGLADVCLIIVFTWMMGYAGIAVAALFVILLGVPVPTTMLFGFGVLLSSSLVIFLATGTLALVRLDYVSPLMGALSMYCVVSYVSGVPPNALVWLAWFVPLVGGSAAMAVIAVVRRRCYVRGRLCC